MSCYEDRPGRSLREGSHPFVWELMLGWGSHLGTHLSYLVASRQPRLHLTTCQIDPDPGSKTWLSGLTCLIIKNFPGNHWAVNDPVIIWSWPVGWTSGLLNSDATTLACLAETLGSCFLTTPSVRKGLPEPPIYKLTILKKKKNKKNHFKGLADCSWNPSTVETRPSARSRSQDRATAHASFCPLAQWMW